MKIVPVSNFQIDNFFLSDPKLSYVGLPDEDLVSLYEHKKVLWESHSQVFGVEDASQIVALVKWEYFTKNTINVHFYTHTWAQRDNKSMELAFFVIDYYKKETELRKLLLMVPSTCNHVKRFASKLGFEQEGRITKSYYWRQELVDIIIYSLDLRN